MPATVKAWQVEIPLIIKSVANLREHWSKRLERNRKHRCDTHTALLIDCGPTGCVSLGTKGRLTITLTRLGGKLMDGDNLQSGFKATRDGVADWLAIDDSDPRLTWVYEQKPAAHPAVRIVVERD